MSGEFTAKEVIHTPKLSNFILASHVRRGMDIHILAVPQGGLMLTDPNLVPPDIHKTGASMGIFLINSLWV